MVTKHTIGVMYYASKKRINKNERKRTSKISFEALEKFLSILRVGKKSKLPNLIE